MKTLQYLNLNVEWLTSVVFSYFFSYLKTYLPSGSTHDLLTVRAFTQKLHRLSKNSTTDLTELLKHCLGVNSGNFCAMKSNSRNNLI